MTRNKTQIIIDNHSISKEVCAVLPGGNARSHAAGVICLDFFVTFLCQDKKVNRDYEHRQLNDVAQKNYYP